MVLTPEIHVSELQLEATVYDLNSVVDLLKWWRERTRSAPTLRHGSADRSPASPASQRSRLE